MLRPWERGGEKGAQGRRLVKRLKSFPTEPLKWFGKLQQPRTAAGWAEQIRGADKEIQMSRRFYGRPWRMLLLTVALTPCFPRKTPPAPTLSCIFHMPEERVDWHFSQSKQKFFFSSLYFFCPDVSLFQWGANTSLSATHTLKQTSITRENLARIRKSVGKWPSLG